MEVNSTRHPKIEISSLPDMSEKDGDFYDTSFFQHDGASSLPQPPTPTEILQHCAKLARGEINFVKFENLNLAVKVKNSSELRLEEAQAMIAVRRVFPNGEVPVPDVFGWRHHGNKVFLYMSLIPGQTLGMSWLSLTEAEKESICHELAGIVAALRRITQDTTVPFIGSVNGGRIQDRYFQFDDEGGPLSSVKLFNDLLLAAATRQKFDPESTITGPNRELLPDTSSIYFTHGDLTLQNIMISGPPGGQRISGIIDWEQAGWYPEYWEYCKMLYAVNYEHEWRAAGWADKVMKPYEDEYWAFSDYSAWRGFP